MLLLVYTTTRKRFVIFTCRYFKLSWNTTALSQSYCRNFLCSGIRYQRYGVKHLLYYTTISCIQRILHGKCWRTLCWRIRNRTSERSERVRFLIQKQRVRKYRTKHFPCGIVFIIYILRHSSFNGVFILNLSKMLKFATTHLPQNDNENEVSAFLVKTFVKNINDGEGMR